MNPGLMHFELRGASRIAKKIGVKYVPCLTGFDYSSGRPEIVGIIIHIGSESILSEACHQQAGIEQDAWSAKIGKKWELMVRKLLIGQRLENEWGNEEVVNNGGKSVKKSAKHKGNDNEVIEIG